MPDVRTIATYLGVFGAGVVTAGFFLSGPVERPNAFENASDFTEYNAVGRPGWLLPPLADVGNYSAPRAAAQSPAGEAAATAAPRQPPPAETTGMAPGPAPQPPPAQQVAQPAASALAQPALAADAGNACNVELCRQYYRSFDEATCSYQPYGGRRQLCTR